MPSPFSLRDINRLVGIHPELKTRLERVFTAMQDVHPMFVVAGIRTQAQQQALYAQGRTVPGPIVTFKDGIVHKSDHQPWKDGFGHAVDCAFLNTATPFDLKLPWETYGRLLEGLGLVWGGRWTAPHDCPHAQIGFVPAPSA